MVEADGFCFDAGDGVELLEEGFALGGVADEFEEEDSVWAAGVGRGFVEAESCFDMAAEFGEEFLDILCFLESVGDVDGGDEVVILHGWSFPGHVPARVFPHLFVPAFSCLLPCTSRRDASPAIIPETARLSFYFLHQSPVWTR